MADDELENQSGGSFLTDADQERQHKELVDRLKKEGQLTRNSGTNSLKSIKLEVGKFDDALSAMRSKLKDQTVAINDLLGVQENALELEKSEIQRLKKKDQLESVQKTLSDKEGDRKDARPGDPKPKPGAMSGFFKRIGPGLGGFLGAAFGGMTVAGIASRFGGLLLRAIPAVTLAPMIGDFVVDFIQAGLSDFNILDDDGFEEGTKKELSRVINWTLIGGVIGGRRGAKIGAILAAGTWLSRALDDIFDLDENIQKMADAFGLEISDDAISAIGSAIGIGIVAIIPTIIRKALWPLLKKSASAIAAAAAGAVGLKGLQDRIRGTSTTQRPSTQSQTQRPGRPGVANRIANMLRDTGRSVIGSGMSARDILLRRGLPVFGLVSPDRIEDGTLQSLTNRILFTEGLEPGSEEWQRRESELVRMTFEDLHGMATGEVRTEAMRNFEMEGIRDELDFLREEARPFVDMNQPIPPSISNRISELEDLINSDNEILEEYERLLGLQNRLFAANEEGPNIGFIDRINHITSQLSEMMQSNPHLREEMERLAREISTGPSEGSPTTRQEEVSQDIEIIRKRELPSRDMPTPTRIEELSNILDDFNEDVDNILNDVSKIFTTIEEAALSPLPPMNIVFAPTTNAPVTSIQQGGSTVSSVTQNSVTSFGGGDGGSGLGRFAN